ncbi:MAG: isocitrate lyase/PEP mutase family protein [Pseudomonadota bacterium]
MTETPLEDRLRSPRVLVAPGVADTLGAVLAERAGFEAVFLSGSAMSYAHLGRPDIGLLSLGEIAAITARIAERVGIPVLVDADSGFGNAYHVHRCVRALERAGAACVQIEDKVNAPDARDMSSNPVVATADMRDKLRAALDARHSDSTLISARTDALSTEGLSGALARIEAYADAGADALFVTGIATADDRRDVLRCVDGRLPVIFNMAVPGGASPPAVAVLEREGFSVALLPATVIGAAASAMSAALYELAAQLPGITARDAEETRTSPFSVADAIRGGEFLAKHRNWSNPQ